MNECKNCGGSGRNPGSQHLDCLECDAAQERMLVEQYWGSLPASMEIVDAIWAVYQFRRAPAPAALTDPLKQQWREAYALFKAAFDTPIARRKIEGNSEYLEAARNALRNFNDALATAATAGVAPAEQARDAERWQFVAENFDDYFTADVSFFDRTFLGPNSTIADAVDNARSKK